MLNFTEFGTFTQTVKATVDGAAITYSFLIEVIDPCTTAFFQTTNPLSAMLVTVPDDTLV